MREIRPSGSEGGVTFKPPSLPLSRRLYIDKSHTICIVYICVY